MAQARQLLTGPWMGRYGYTEQPLPPVAFNATLLDEDGDLSGDVIEPNAFGPGGPESETLLAGVIGVREGRLVRWTKRYSDFAAPRIDYEGEVNAPFTRISGRWRFPEAPRWSGPFVMIRDAVGAEAARQRVRRSQGALRLPRDGEA
ncbi:MAG: hypothetical protein ACU0CO_00035 [Shimia sp.]